MASITFRTDGPVTIDNLNGSGLGFYGNGFGTSILVGQYNQTTFITNGAGTSQGAQADNIQYIHPNSGVLNGGTTYNLLSIPNKDATFQIQFYHSSPVQVQNARLYIYDRVSINNGASGVTTKLAEIIHPDPVALPTGSGSSSWKTINAGVASSILLAQSPGASGLWAGPGTTSTRADNFHTWAIALSPSPDSIGSKTNYGAYFSVEYL